MTEAALALAARDAERLEALQHHARGWMQSAAEEEAQRMMLMAMTEAAYLLEGEPSELND